MNNTLIRKLIFGRYNKQLTLFGISTKASVLHKIISPSVQKVETSDNTRFIVEQLVRVCAISPIICRHQSSSLHLCNHKIRWSVPGIFSDPLNFVIRINTTMPKGWYNSSMITYTMNIWKSSCHISENVFIEHNRYRYIIFRNSSNGKDSPDLSKKRYATWSPSQTISLEQFQIPRELSGGWHRCPSRNNCLKGHNCQNPYNCHSSYPSLWFSRLLIYCWFFYFLNQSNLR